MIDTTTWLCGPPPATGQFQRYPSRLLFNLNKFYGDQINHPTLEMFSGSSGWGNYTTDINHESNAEIVCPFDDLPFSRSFFDAVLADPPYTMGFARQWTDLEKDIPKPKHVLREAARVTIRDGLIFILHVIVIPAYKELRVERIALHPILCGPNNAIRVLNVFRKL